MEAVFIPLFQRNSCWYEVINIMYCNLSIGYFNDEIHNPTFSFPSASCKFILTVQ